MPENLFEDLKEVLQEFKDFLNDKVAVIKPAVQALAALIPQINELIDQLVTLLGRLKTEIQNLNISGIPGVQDVSEFTNKAKAALEAAKGLLPEEAESIDQVIEVANVVSGLPGLSDQVKAEIVDLIDDIVGLLNQLKS